MKKYLLIAFLVFGVFILLPSIAFANSASFKVGSNQYNVDGQNKTMDVAPFIENSRTYLPVRYLADALGISNDNILWDSAHQTVSLFKGSKVVQVTIGSNALKINGSNIVMDVPPKMVSGRIFLPLRWLAQAFDVSLNWDENNHTIGIGDIGNNNSEVGIDGTKVYLYACASFGKTLGEAVKTLISIKGDISQGYDYDDGLTKLYNTIDGGQNKFNAIAVPDKCKDSHNYLNLMFIKVKEMINDARLATSFTKTGDISKAMDYLIQMSDDANDFLDYSGKCLAALQEEMKIYNIN